METIQFRNVSFSYPGTERKALDDINLSVEKSDFVVLCGKSGCGKSTFLKHLKKNLMPYGNLEGAVLYGQENIADLDNRVNASEIGFVQQNPDNQIVTDKVWHELAFGLESLGFHNAAIKKRVAEMASFFGIQTWYRKDVAELSGGQKQLLNLASIMVMQPKVLILDEPTSQLDPIAATDFLHTIQRINQEFGTTIIISEHRLEEVFPMADKVIVMDEGRISAYDTPRNVGKLLYSGQEKHPMFYGLPSVMKIFAEVGAEGDCPLTIREGRLWLEKVLPEETAYTEDEEMVSAAEVKKDESIIKIDDVWFRYDRDSDDILRGINIEVKKGEIFCLLGGNGVGKSTTLKSVCGIVKPYRGTITVDGIKVQKSNNKELFNHRLGMLPQNPQALFTEITVEEELFEALYYIKIKHEEKLKKIDEMLELLELTYLRKSHPYDLSGGEQQRLALGKILLLEPKILLLDEPTKGLDPFFKKTLGFLFETLRGQGVTLFIVSHDIEFCASYADRCSLFFDGDIVSTGSPKEFFSGNNFYTTISNRLVRQWFPKAVTYEEVAGLCARVLT
jgi:energy-coupling factor transporter ATP-binding protein EcfA2